MKEAALPIDKLRHGVARLASHRRSRCAGIRVKYPKIEEANVKTLNSIWWRQKQVQPVPAVAISAVPLAPAFVTEPLRAPEGVRYIARQAIFDVSQKVFGYELLARSGWENRFTGDSDEATRRMIADGALYGFEELTRGTRSFINCTRESLVEGLVTVLPKTVVLEVLETIDPDDEVIAACRSLKEMGHQIALDDFCVRQGMRELVELADYIKVDFRASDKAARQQIREFVKDTGAKLIAEKVETGEEFKIAVEEGYDLFQGYFFCRPTVFAKKVAPATGNNYFRLLAALSQTTVDFVEITRLVKSEVTICYQLLRLVNSAAFGLNRQVQSIGNALAMVGEERFRKLVLNAIAVEGCKAHPDELLIRVLQRSRFLELVSPYTGEDAGEQYMFGLLSLMGAMLGTPIQDLVRALPLRAEVKDGLKGAANGVTCGLRLLQCYEEGEWPKCMELAFGLEIHEAELASLYEESLFWAQEAATPDHRKDFD